MSNFQKKLRVPAKCEIPSEFRFSSKRQQTKNKKNPKTTPLKTKKVITVRDTDRDNPLRPDCTKPIRSRSRESSFAWQRPAATRNEPDCRGSPGAKGGRDGSAVPGLREERQVKGEPAVREGGGSGSVRDGEKGERKCFRQARCAQRGRKVEYPRPRIHQPGRQFAAGQSRLVAA